MKLSVLFCLICAALPATARPLCSCSLRATRHSLNYGRVALLREFFRADGSLAFSEQAETFSWGEDTVVTNAHLQHLVGYYPTQEVATSTCEIARSAERRAGRCL